MKISLAASLLLAGSMTFGLPASYAAELKLGHFLPPRHTNHTVVMQPFADEVAKKTGGSLTVRIFPSLQLGGKPAGQYNQVKSGISDISFVTMGYTPTVFPGSGIIELPYLTKDAKHATRILHGLYKDHLAREFKDVKVLTMWTVDNFVVQSRAPIRKLADMKGMKIRTPSSTQSAFIRALGGVPVNMPITKVYTSLERGVIDAFYAGSSAVFSFKLIEVVNHYTSGLGNGNLGVSLLMNKGSWNKLPAAHKKAIDDASGIQLGMKGATAYDKKYAAGLAVAAKRKGVTVAELPASEQAAARKIFQPVIEKWIADREKQGIKGRAMYEAARAIN